MKTGTLVRRLRWVFAVAAVALSGVYCILMFRAGREGDAKTGMGNTIGALHYEALSEPFLLGSLILGVGFIALSPTRVGDRLKCAVALFFLGGLVLWILGLYIETWGIRSYPTTLIP